MSNTNQADIKICKDCKYFTIVDVEYNVQAFYCKLASRSTIDVVTGKEIWWHNKACATMRNEFNSCGPSGKLWEKR